MWTGQIYLLEDFLWQLSKEHITKLYQIVWVIHSLMLNSCLITPTVARTLSTAHHTPMAHKDKPLVLVCRLSFKSVKYLWGCTMPTVHHALTSWDQLFGRLLLVKHFYQFWKDKNHNKVLSLHRVRILIGPNQYLNSSEKAKTEIVRKVPGEGW